MNNKKVEIISIGFSILSLMSFLIVIILGIVVINYTADTTESIDTIITPNSSTQGILTESSVTLSPHGDEIISSEVKTYNDIWLNLNGIDSYILLEESEAKTLTFWYNSSTSETWQFVANISGTTYVNDTLNTPDEYPIYYNGTHYFIGKTNSTNFWEGSIDEFRIYSGLLNKTQTDSIYGEGR